MKRTISLVGLLLIPAGWTMAETPEAYAGKKSAAPGGQISRTEMDKLRGTGAALPPDYQGRPFDDAAYRGLPLNQTTLAQRLHTLGYWGGTLDKPHFPVHNDDCRPAAVEFRWARHE